MLRAEQPELLGAPESETHLALQLVGVLQCGELFRDLQDRRCTAAIVIDPGSGDHRIKVRAHHNGLPLILPFGESAMMFCVVRFEIGLSRGDDSRSHEPRGFVLGVQVLTVGKADPDGRRVLRVAQRAGQQLRATRLDPR